MNSGFYRMILTEWGKNLRGEELKYEKKFSDVILFGLAANIKRG